MGNENKSTNIHHSTPNNTILQTQEPQQDTPQLYSDQIALRQEALLPVPPNNMTRRLHQYIGAIQIRYRNHKKKGHGTGILISPNLVLTCAHSLHSNTQHLQPSTILFYPALYGSMTSSFVVQTYFLPQQFKQSNIPKYDYALLKLKQTVKQSDLPHADNSQAKHKFIKLRHLFLSSTIEEEIALFGYPLISYRHSAIHGQQQKTEHQSYQMGLIRRGDAIVHAKKGKIQHYISTEMGQSGSPLITINHYQGRQILNIIGIHKAAKPKQLIKPSQLNTISKQQARRRQQQYNVGCLITQDIINILQKQASRMGAIMFERVRPIIYIGSHEVDYFAIRGATCQTISRVLLKLDDNKAKTTCFLLDDKVYKPHHRLMLGGQLQNYLTYCDEQQPINIKLLTPRDIFYHNMISIGRDESLQHKILDQLQSYLTEQKRYKMNIIAQKCTNKYFQQSNHLIPMFCFTDRYQHMQYTQFLNQLNYPFLKTSLKQNMFGILTAMIIKHAQQLPIYKGMCYYLANYASTQYQIGNQLILKHFLQCSTQKPSPNLISPQFTQNCQLWQIECQSGRQFYQVSSWPSQNQVTLLPFCTLTLISQSYIRIGKHRLKQLRWHQTSTGYF